MQERNEIQEELKELESSLAGMSKQLPYEVPRGYFESVPAQILARALDEDIIPRLPSSTPLEVPGGYFDQLPAQLLNRIKEEEKPKGRVINLGTSLSQKIRLAAAAAVILLAGAGILRFSLEQNSFERKLASLPEGSAQEYVVQNADGFEQNMATAATSTLPNSLSEEEIVEYLDETGWQ